MYSKLVREVKNNGELWTNHPQKLSRLLTRSSTIKHFTKVVAYERRLFTSGGRTLRFDCISQKNFSNFEHPVCSSNPSRLKTRSSRKISCMHSWAHPAVLITNSLCCFPFCTSAWRGNQKESHRYFWRRWCCQHMESGTTEVFGSDSRHQLFSCKDFSMLLCFLTCCLVVSCLAVCGI